MSLLSGYGVQAEPWMMPEFAAETSILSTGSVVLAVLMPVNATLDQVSLETASSDAAFYLIGEQGNFAQFKAGGVFVPHETSGLSRPLGKGLYYLYFWTLDGEPLVTKLSFVGLEGNVEVVARDEVTMEYSDILPESPLAQSEVVLKRFQLDHDGDRPSIAGIVRFQEVNGPATTESRTYRWSTPAGTLFCSSNQHTLAGVHADWLGSEYEWFIFPDLPAGPLRVEFIESGATLETRNEVRLLAIERALGDDTPVPWVPRPPVPHLQDELRYDPYCLPDTIGTAIGNLSFRYSKDFPSE